MNGELIFEAGLEILAQVIARKYLLDREAQNKTPVSGGEKAEIHGSLTHRKVRILENAK